MVASRSTPEDHSVSRRGCERRRVRGGWRQRPTTHSTLTSGSRALAARSRRGTRGGFNESSPAVANGVVYVGTLHRWERGSIRRGVRDHPVVGSGWPDRLSVADGRQRGALHDLVYGSDRVQTLDSAGTSLTNTSSQSIGRITTGGVVTNYTLAPLPLSSPQDIAAGPDGAM